MAWRYAPPFDYYNPPDHQNSEPSINKIVDEFVDPDNGFFSVRDEQRRFVGFCSFGLDGRVLGGCYDDSALDIGLGMKPEWTGMGNGTEFFSAITGYALGDLGASTLRLTVADFNERALRLYLQSGFQVVDHFLDALNAVPHTVMVKR